MSDLDDVTLRHTGYSATAHAQAAQTLADLLAEAVKADQRDRREPGRERKAQRERKLEAALMAYFRRMVSKVRARVPAREAKSPFPADFFNDAGLDDALYIILLDAAQDGIALTGETLKLELDPELTNPWAEQWARRYAAELVRGLNTTTRDQVRNAIEDFITTPGMTLADLIERLPFDEARAATVAVTEVTRAYAQGALAWGEAAREQFPDVAVVKVWFTNSDDRVCDICGPLEGRTVDLAEPFTEDLDAPPAHPNCRCWIDTRTQIGGERG